MGEAQNEQFKCRAKQAVETLWEQNKEFAIIALTGKIKSGTSDVCTLLTSSKFPGYATRPANASEDDMGDVRENLLVYRFLHHNWKVFVEINVKNVIISFLLDEDMHSLKEFDSRQVTRNNTSKEDGIISTISKCILHEDLKVNALEEIKKVNSAIRYKSGDASKKGFDFALSEEETEEACARELQKILERVQRPGKDQTEELLKYWKEINPKLNAPKCSLDIYVFCFGFLPAFGKLFEAALTQAETYTEYFQSFGNSIRATGKAIWDESNFNEEAVQAECTSECDEESSFIFCLPRRVNQFVKILRHYRNMLAHEGVKEPYSQSVSANSKELSNQIFIVINLFKNIFESFYFKRRYSAFYLLAVSSDEEKRRARYGNDKAFYFADLRENLARAKGLYKKVNKAIKDQKDLSQAGAEDKYCRELGLTKKEFAFMQDIYLSDTLRKQCYDSNLAPFILQDVMTCVENADVFLTRNHDEADCFCDYPLVRALGRIVTLILHPALLTPTKIERCMQLAITAKLNSGCLSRQVGAVVTDQQYNILSLGWNDAPCGLETCMRRNLFDLMRKHDDKAYSEFELNDEKFRDYLDVISPELDTNEKKASLKGLPMAFCFKDIYQDMIKQRDQVYTRALHGEERALAACGNDRAKGGFLFTTSSPCELCAKKAKEANISKIYFIEQYPGISQKQIINAGSERAKYEFFVGAVGVAYVKLYTPLLPYKDELAAYEFSPVEIYKRIKTPPNTPTPVSLQSKTPDDSSKKGASDSSQVSQEKQSP